MSQAAATEVLGKKPKRRVEWVQKRLREELATPGLNRDVLYEVLTRKEGRAFVLDVSASDAARVYGALLFAIELFTIRQQKQLRSESFVLRQLHDQEQVRAEQAAAVARASRSAKPPAQAVPSPPEKVSQKVDSLKGEEAARRKAEARAVFVESTSLASTTAQGGQRSAPGEHADSTRASAAQAAPRPTVAEQPLQQHVRSPEFAAQDVPDWAPKTPPEEVARQKVQGRQLPGACAGSTLVRADASQAKTTQGVACQAPASENSQAPGPSACPSLQQRSRSRSRSAPQLPSRTRCGTPGGDGVGGGVASASEHHRASSVADDLADALLLDDVSLASLSPGRSRSSSPSAQARLAAALAAAPAEGSEQDALQPADPGGARSPQVTEKLAPRAPEQRTKAAVAQPRLPRSHAAFATSDGGCGSVAAPLTASSSSTAPAPQVCGGDDSGKADPLKLKPKAAAIMPGAGGHTGGPVPKAFLRRSVASGIADGGRGSSGSAVEVAQQKSAQLREILLQQRRKLTQSGTANLQPESASILTKRPQSSIASDARSPEEQHSASCQASRGTVHDRAGQTPQRRRKRRRRRRRQEDDEDDDHDDEGETSGCQHVSMLDAACSLQEQAGEWAPPPPLLTGSAPLHKISLPTRVAGFPRDSRQLEVSFWVQSAAGQHHSAKSEKPVAKTCSGGRPSGLCEDEKDANSPEHPQVVVDPYLEAAADQGAQELIVLDDDDDDDDGDGHGDDDDGKAKAAGASGAIGGLRLDDDGVQSVLHRKELLRVRLSQKQQEVQALRSRLLSKMLPSVLAAADPTAAASAEEDETWEYAAYEDGAQRHPWEGPADGLAEGASAEPAAACAPEAQAPFDHGSPASAPAQQEVEVEVELEPPALSGGDLLSAAQLHARRLEEKRRQLQEMLARRRALTGSAAPAAGARSGPLADRAASCKEEGEEDDDNSDEVEIVETSAPRSFPAR